MIEASTKVYKIDTTFSQSIHLISIKYVYTCTRTVCFSSLPLLHWYREYGTGRGTNYLEDKFNYEYLILRFGYPSHFASTNNCGNRKRDIFNFDSRQLQQDSLHIL